MGSILRLYEVVKPGSSGADPPCPRCDGLGRHIAAEGEPTCDHCEGEGRVIVIGEEAPAEQPHAPYVATVGGGELAEGYGLKPFVDELLADWPESFDDIVVWRVGADGLGSMRVAAVLRPKPRGGLSVTWM